VGLWVAEGVVQTHIRLFPSIRRLKHVHINRVIAVIHTNDIVRFTTCFGPYRPSEDELEEHTTGD
jgi:hypothetical protein